MPTVAVLCVSGDEPSSDNPNAEERRLELSALSSTWRNTAGVGGLTIPKLPLSGLRLADPLLTLERLLLSPLGLWFPEPLLVSERPSGVRLPDPLLPPEELSLSPSGLRLPEPLLAHGGLSLTSSGLRLSDPLRTHEGLFLAQLGVVAPDPLLAPKEALILLGLSLADPLPAPVGLSCRLSEARLGEPLRGPKGLSRTCEEKQEKPDYKCFISIFMIIKMFVI